MKAERLLAALALALGLAAAASAAPKAKGLDAPTGLILKALDNGRWQLVWDPIYRDDLMGYSVWLRRPGEKEFTRLKIPVKVGKEVKQVPMTSHANITLALGSKRDLEFTVVAEYEDGSSPRSVSAFSRDLAAAPAAAAAIPVPGAAASPTPGPAPDAAGEEAAKDEPKSFTARLPQADRPLITPLGKLRTQVDVGFDYHRYMSSGTENPDIYGYSTWSIITARRVFTLPLTASYGILPGIEVWARAGYDAETAFVDTEVIDGTVYVNGIYYTFDAEGNKLEANPNTAGLGDTDLGLRIQPIERWPLVVGLRGEMPTGKSRVQSSLDWLVDRGSETGNGLGVARVGGELDWGRVGQREGLSFHAAYLPAATERFKHDFLYGLPLEHVFRHGSETTLGGAYTMPWTLLGQEGALALGIQVTSVEAARWTAQDIDIPSFYGPVAKAELSSFFQAKFIRDDRLDASLQFFQDLPNGFRSSGKLSYVWATQGDTISLSGTFFY